MNIYNYYADIVSRSVPYLITRDVKSQVGPVKVISDRTPQIQQTILGLE